MPTKSALHRHRRRRPRGPEGAVHDGFGRSANLEHQEGSLFWAMDNWMYSTVNAFRGAGRRTAWGASRPASTAHNGARHRTTTARQVPGGRLGTAVVVPVPIVYGNFEVPDQYEPGFRRAVGRAGEARRHAGRDGCGTHARWLAQSRDGWLGCRRLPRASAAGRPARRLPLRRSGGTHRARCARSCATGSCSCATSISRSSPSSSAPPTAVPSGRWRRRPRQRLRGRHVPRHRAGGAMGAEGIVPAREGGAVPARQDHGARTDLAADVRRAAARPRAAAHAARVAGAAGAPPRHPNGWWRDMAQQLLVLAQDRSVVPALTAMARRDTMLVARFHALGRSRALARSTPRWCASLKDPSPRMRIQRSARASRSGRRGTARSRPTIAR